MLGVSSQYVTSQAPLSRRTAYSPTPPLLPPHPSPYHGRSPPHLRIRRCAFRYTHPRTPQRHTDPAALLAERHQRVAVMSLLPSPSRSSFCRRIRTMATAFVSPWLRLGYRPHAYLPDTYVNSKWHILLVRSLTLLPRIEPFHAVASISSTSTLLSSSTAPGTAESSSNPATPTLNTSPTQRRPRGVKIAVCLHRALLSAFPR